MNLVASFLMLLAGAAPVDEVASLIASLNKAYEERNDEGVPPIVDKLVLAYRTGDEKVKADIAKAVARGLEQRRDTDKDPKAGEKLYLASAAALSEMGDVGARAMSQALKDKNFKKRVDVRAVFVTQIGAIKDVKNVKMLTDYLKDNEPKLVAAAADGLAYYRESPEKVRKDIVEELVKAYATADGNVKKNPKDPVGKDRLQAIEVSMNSALLALTGQSFEDATKWQAWFNDNKAKSWSKEKANG